MMGQTLMAIFNFGRKGVSCLNPADTRMVKVRETKSGKECLLKERNKFEECIKSTRGLI